MAFKDDQPRSVNSLLGAQPKFGFIPAEQLFPWMVISFGIYFFAQGLLKLGWTWTVLLIFWGDVTWWLLTGSKPYKFLSKFVSTPTWTRARVQYRSIFSEPDTAPVSASKKSRKSRAKATVKGKRNK